MSVETYVRFRPVGPLDKASGDPVGLARARWTAELQKNPDVVGFKFATGRIGAPKERPEALVGDKQPVDITITWTSIDKASGVFSNNALFEFLCGYVVGAPQVVIEGDPQIMEEPR